MVILFDLDGTIIDSTEAILHSFKKVFKDLKKTPPSDEEIKRLIGLPLDVMFGRFEVSDVSLCVKMYKLNYKEVFLKKTKLIKGAKEAIELAHSFAKLGIVTTKTGKYSKELMEYFGVMKYFDVLIGREDVINPKPHPEPILKAIHILKANREATWMIGDTCLDMVSAKEAGIRYVGVEWEYEKRLRECSEVVKKDVLDAVRYIKGIYERL